MMQLADHLVLLAGPILRKVTTQQITLWLVTSCPVDIKLSLKPEQQANQDYDVNITALDKADIDPSHVNPSKLDNRSNQADEPSQTHTSYSIKIGKKCYLYLIDIALEQPLPTDTWIAYQLSFKGQQQTNWQTLTELLSDIHYPEKDTPGFVIRSRLQYILHGSCRKPHHHSDDGLLQADNLLANNINTAEQWPSLLLHSGDQIYADDVATPMLVAIHGLLKQLGCENEQFTGASISDANSLYQDQSYYNHRETILPKDKVSGEAKKLLFSSVKKPIFTSDHAGNHLISLAEVMAMYLLTWSPQAWQYTQLTMPHGLTEKEQATYRQEQAALENFSQGLNQVRRVMAHLPCAMIFDDHDVTDDWNLTANWERVAYQNNFSRRIIGNTLVAYLLCQGWGNAPEKFNTTLLKQAQQSLIEPGGEIHEQLIYDLLKFDQWHYQWDTQPNLIVLDTRTQRWLSISNPDTPSGLMDWEALTDLQQNLFGQDAVVLVSAAPIFGVKLIEAIQQVFTWFGKPLMVDAENWMAHKGAAHCLMHSFCHPKTPQHFVILSGDVHYSFASLISIKGRKNSPNVWQITSSGLRNQFPDELLNWLDRLNRWLYSPRSPLNWFTKRRKMRIEPLKPSTAAKGERLVNQTGIGLVELDKSGEPISIKQLVADQPAVQFVLTQKSKDKN